MRMLFVPCLLLLTLQLGTAGLDNPSEPAAEEVDPKVEALKNKIKKGLLKKLSASGFGAAAAGIAAESTNKASHSSPDDDGADALKEHLKETMINKMARGGLPKSPTREVEGEEGDIARHLKQKMLSKIFQHGGAEQQTDASTAEGEEDQEEEEEEEDNKRRKIYRALRRAKDDFKSFTKDYMKQIMLNITEQAETEMPPSFMVDPVANVNSFARHFTDMFKGLKSGLKHAAHQTSRSASPEMPIEIVSRGKKHEADPDEGH